MTDPRILFLTFGFTAGLLAGLSARWVLVNVAGWIFYLWTWGRRG